jgi:hypothetical protein
MKHYTDFIDAGYKVFGLHGILPSGLCACGWDKCIAAGKHPQASNWQHTPHWSEEQLETLAELGQFASGYGVLVEGLLVVDVDARNGGMKSYARLLEEIPEIAAAGLIVNTGSGGGSKHLYFAMPEPVALVQSLTDYPGIDFKSSGFVVGPGSLHSSGKHYETALGTPFDITAAPAALLRLLIKPDRHRAKIDAQWVDISDAELADMLSHIPNSSGTDYEQWIRVGMAIHHGTAGSGYDLWHRWSAQSAKHDDTGMDKKWHSFGKSSNPVTLGTLVHYAQQQGWLRPVTFAAGWEPPQADLDAGSIDTSGVDLLRPPGFTGELVGWVNSQSIFPRETLAVAASLMAISNCGGMRYTDPLDNGAFNLFCFGVADSSTGKEAILQAHNDLLKAAGISPALVGGIKSEQEIYRNLIRHQAAFYSIDELGEHLAKISNSRSRGGAVYLEGVIGTLMSIYSKSNSFVAVTGDLKEEIKQGLIAEQRRLQKAIDDEGDSSGAFARRVVRIIQQLKTVDMGIENPFLSIFGLTTPDRFDKLMDYEMAVNGFMGRALIFRELEGNPRIKPRSQRNKQPVPDRIKYTLINLYAPGYSIEDGARVERIGDKAPIQTTDEAAQALDLVGELFWELAEKHKDETGLHPIPRRGYELTAKVAAVLAMPSGLRTLEHVRWAYALVRKDIDSKMLVARSNSAEITTDALTSKILTMVTTEHGEALGAIQRGCKAYKPEDVKIGLDKLVEAKVLTSRESTGRGRPTTRYFLAK